VKRVAVIGATGQLGGELVRALEDAGADVLPLSHQDIECAEAESVHGALSEVRPEVVVNCAAFVRVDEAEWKPEETFRVNAVGALHVARTCRDLGAKCVYVSTDYVFDGEKGDPYTEEDCPRPINVYGASKLVGEHLVLQTSSEALVVRLASLYGGRGARGKGTNFVLTVLGRARRGEPLRVVDDIRMSPTYAHDAAVAISQLVERGATGVFHVVNEGSCTWYEFAKAAVAVAGFNAVVEPVSRREYPTKARRPTDSALSTGKLRGANIRMRPWKEALTAYVESAAEGQPVRSNP
jgi:dTDP-4-dehydrorhamnose reductase